MTAENGGTRGMLSKEASRKSVSSTLAGLYRGDLAFRGMIDFAVIGAVVMMFLHPPHTVKWPWSKACLGLNCNSQLDPGSGPGSEMSTGGATQNTPNVEPSVATLSTGPVIPIPYPEGLKSPRLGVGFLFDIDQAAFTSSKTEDRPKLEAALAGIAHRKPDIAIEALRAADGDDPNVALLRGASFVLRNADDANATALALWRQAVTNGSVQAKALLGRLLLSGRGGITPNMSEGRKLIEAGAAAGDRQALRFAGIGYLSGDFGQLDPAKAADLLKKAADAGDASAMAFYSRMAAEGIGMAGPDGKEAERYLRKAADSGLTLAQYTLAQWLIAQYQKGLVADPQEAIDLLTRAYEKGGYVVALNELAFVHASVAKSKPWLDKKIAHDLLRRCSAFSYGHCQYNNGIAWGYAFSGTADLKLARAHFAVSKGMNYAGADKQIEKVDAKLSAAEKKEAEAIEDSIRKALVAVPELIPLQYAGINPPPPPVAEFAVKVADTATASIKDDDVYKQCIDGSLEAAKRGEACQKVVERGKGTAVELSNAHFGVGWAHGKLNEYDKAIASYTEGIKLAPNYVILNNRGSNYLRKKEPDKAIADFDQSLKLKPNYIQALANRAEARRIKGEFLAAMADINKALEIDGKNDWATTIRNRIKKDLDDLKSGKAATSNDNKVAEKSGAEKSGSAAASDDSDEIKSLRERALRHMKNKDADSAIADFSEIIRREKGNTFDYANRAIAYEYRNNPDKALEDYTRSIRKAGHPGVAHYNRGRIYMARGEIDKAIEDFTANIEQHGAGDPNSFAERAKAYLKKSLFDQALQDYDRVVDIMEKDKSTEKNLKALAYFLRGKAKVAKALGDINKCMSMIPAPDNCDGPLQYATALLDLETARALKPDYADAHFYVGWIADRIGNKRLAIENYTKTIQADSNYSTAYNNRGVIYADMKQWELAMADYTDAIRADPKNTSAWTNRGILFANRRNRSRAIADLREALAIQPDYGNALNALRRLGVKR
ncbi:MAG: tetratricopeptide repeat protein [Hyphomicrobiaceae bacterium]|nr:tetratricopeptide repeat protein [Hyphomicrobiaceae bacterium]